MERVPIRDLKSPKEVKPRVFDALISQDEVLLDVKDSKKGNVVIPLTDVLRQIESAPTKTQRSDYRALIRGGNAQRDTTCRSHKSSL